LESQEHCFVGGGALSYAKNNREHMHQRRQQEKPSKPGCQIKYCPNHRKNRNPGGIGDIATPPRYYDHNTKTPKMHPKEWVRATRGSYEPGHQ
jgi:hypothetical protein